VQNGDNGSITVSIIGGQANEQSLELQSAQETNAGSPLRSPVRDFVERSINSLALTLRGELWRPDRMRLLPPQEVIGGIKAIGSSELQAIAPRGKAGRRWGGTQFAQQAIRPVYPFFG
jgi:hypothetical protein